MRNLILFLLTFTVFACSKNDNVANEFLDCNVISDHFKEYNDEKIECQFHYRLAEYNAIEYIELHAHCAHLTRPYVFNKDCIDICEVVDGVVNPLCNEYLLGRETKEILLIAKE